MAVQTQTIPQVEQPGGVHRFTIEEYHKVLETGIFEGQRIELLDGEITIMSPIGNPHRTTVSRLMRKLKNALGDLYTFFSQSAAQIAEYNEPEPDVVVAKFRDDDYAGISLEPKDIHLIIEVAKSSLSTDRNKKRLTYATFNVPEYWIANLKDFQIEVFKQPKDGDYQVKEIYKMGDSVTCEEIDFMISVEDLFKYLKKNNSK